MSFDTVQNSAYSSQKLDDVLQCCKSLHNWHVYMCVCVFVL